MTDSGIRCKKIMHAHQKKKKKIHLSFLNGKTHSLQYNAVEEHAGVGVTKAVGGGSASQFAVHAPDMLSRLDQYRINCGGWKLSGKRMMCHHCLCSPIFSSREAKKITNKFKELGIPVYKNKLNIELVQVAISRLVSIKVRIGGLVVAAVISVWHVVALYL